MTNVCAQFPTPVLFLRSVLVLVLLYGFEAGSGEVGGILEVVTGRLSFTASGCRVRGESCVISSPVFLRGNGILRVKLFKPVD